MLVINVLLGGVFFLLSWIVYQDFKNRAIFWFLPSVLFIAGTAMSLLKLESLKVVNLLLFNWLVFLLQLLIVWAYFILVKGINNRKARIFFDTYIGWGDVLFILAIAPFFSALNYVAFLLASLLVCLVWVSVSRIINCKGMPTVPLAGIFSICLIVILIADRYTVCVNLYDDSALLYLLM